jgi:phospholipase C
MSERPDREAEERFAEEHPEAHMRRREFLARTAALAGAAGLASVLPVDRLLGLAARQEARAAPLPSPGDLPVDTFVVMMMENRSFDHYFGWRHDADGQNKLTYPDAQGNPHPTHRLAPDFQGCGFDDPDHSWEGGRSEYANGKLDGFLTTNDEYAIGYYLEQDLPFIPHLAKAFTLYDRYFCSLLGPTWPNREYMHSAQSGGNKSNGSPGDVINAYNSGGLYRWETIWDRMLAKGLTATYYGSDLPFIAIFGSRYVAITKTIADFYEDAAAGTLPNLAFVDPPFLDGGGGNGLSGDEHPHGDVRIGQAVMSDVAHAFIESSQFRRGAMFVNYDEWGGFFDHVPPRLVPDDRSSNNLDENFGITGFRNPAVAISPYARRGHVSHMTLTHESILKLISYRFGLDYLTKRHRYASNIGSSFDWEHPKFDPPDLPDPGPPVTTPCGSILAEREAASEQEEHEGLHIGDPVVIEYMERQGYKIEPATPERIFRNPSKATERLGRQWRAERSR